MKKIINVLRLIVAVAWEIRVGLICSIIIAAAILVLPKMASATIIFIVGIFISYVIKIVKGG